MTTTYPSVGTSTYTNKISLCSLLLRNQALLCILKEKNCKKYKEIWILRDSSSRNCQQVLLRFKNVTYCPRTSLDLSAQKLVSTGKLHTNAQRFLQMFSSPWVIHCNTLSSRKNKELSMHSWCSTTPPLPHPHKCKITQNGSRLK